jgi:hypothetical protein
VSEKDTAAARRDEGPPAIAEQQQRQEVAAVNKPPNRVQKEAGATAIPQTASPDPGDMSLHEINNLHNLHLNLHSTMYYYQISGKR